MAGGTTGAAGTTGNAGTGGPVTYTQTVQNYLAWRDTTENGTVHPASVPPGGDLPVATLIAAPRVA
jgi:hypothetical protein